MKVTRGEIYLAELPVAGRSIQAGFRPVVVISNDDGCNEFSPVINVVPLTSNRSKNNLPTHITVSKECGLLKDSVALVEQSMLISKDILIKKVGDCDPLTIRSIDRAILIQFGLLKKVQNTIQKHARRQEKELV